MYLYLWLYLHIYINWSAAAWCPTSTPSNQVINIERAAPAPLPDSQSSKSSLFPQWFITMSLKINRHIWFYFTNSDPILHCPKCIFLCDIPIFFSLFLLNSIFWFQTFFWPILKWQQHQGKYVAIGGGSIWSFWWWWRWWWCIFSKCIFRMYFFQKRIFQIFQVLFFKYYPLVPNFGAGIGSKFVPHKKLTWPLHLPSFLELVPTKHTFVFSKFSFQFQNLPCYSLQKCFCFYQCFLKRLFANSRLGSMWQEWLKKSDFPFF